MSEINEVTEKQPRTRHLGVLTWQHWSEGAWQDLANPLPFDGAAEAHRWLRERADVGDGQTERYRLIRVVEVVAATAEVRREVKWSGVEDGN